jgi:hypothetical protein
MIMFVNQTGSEKGLQFPDEGMEVTLPLLVTSVRMRLGTLPVWSISLPWIAPGRWSARRRYPVKCLCQCAHVRS